MNKWLVLLLALVTVATILAMLATAAMAEPGPEPKVVMVNWESLEHILDGHSFKSQEELFQMLCTLYTEHPQDSLQLGVDVLAQLQQHITTIFPLAGCQSISLHDGRVTFNFKEDQDVSIAHTWHQASLKLSKRLVLQIESVRPSGMVDSTGIEADPEATSIRFRVVEGSMRVHFSFLLKILGRQLRDAEGSELIYLVNEREKISRLSLIERSPLKANMLQIVATEQGQDRETLWIDILHPDFPDHKDVGIAGQTINFLGTEVELLPEGMIRIGRAEPVKNVEAWRWFMVNFDQFREFGKTGTLANRIDYTRNFGYYFEERRIAITLGFQGGEALP